METQKNSILIVDDEALSIRALSDILRFEYKIFVEKKATKVVESAKRLMPDLILLDIMMPEMNGFEVIRKIKEDSELKDIPVIFITGLSDPDDEASGFESGAVDYIQKPYREISVKIRVRHQISMVNLMRKLQELSVTDELTGVGNRRYFLKSLQQAWERARREQRPIGLMMLDLDRFKNLNDVHGHLNGDLVLIHIAQVIQAEVKRATDVVARWGGEEFVVIQPDTCIEGTRKVAEDLRKTIENSKILLDGQESISVTASIGINCIVPDRDGGYTPEDLLFGADEALYVAKQEGRNCVRSFES